MEANIHTFFKKLTDNRLIQLFAKTHGFSVSPRFSLGKKTSIGWGYKFSGIFAKFHSPAKDFLLFEDGFVRSLFPGYRYGRIYSIVADRSGIYYDAYGESDLIKFLNKDIPAPAFWPAELEPESVRTALNLFRKSGISKYNCHPSRSSDPSFPSFPSGVLVVDQTRGDAAIKYGGLCLQDFDRMLIDAIEENPDLTIYVKTHPDHHYRRKKSCFSESLLRHPRISILSPDTSPADCFSFAKKVYVGSSLMGMEALIHDCEVVCYGWSFYAGWGLTLDRSSFPKPPRKNSLSLCDLFSASYLRYTHYFDPDSGKPCSFERILEHIRLQHDQWRRHSTPFVSFGLSPWKKHVLGKYTYPHQALCHAHSERQLDKYVDAGSQIYTWGKKQLPGKYSQLKPIRIEDGFIRSRGLGAAFNFPLSWVFDDVGIYFDSSAPSKLEQLLTTTQFTQEDLRATEELLEFLKEQKITKYNLGISEVKIPDRAKGKRVILVPGQVDSDASITFGSPKIRNNRQLVEEIRRQHPEAFLCYKPHPDLVAGVRADAPLWPGIEEQIDFLISEGDIISWIQAVDEVHTLTSTVGFEALLHNKPVFTYGLPFYAGWGLTNDWLNCERRQRKRSFVELATAIYRLYPTYLNPKSGEFTTALNVVRILINPDFHHDSRPPLLKLLNKIKTQFYKLSFRWKRG
jgi:capsular polysaccharide export protein